MIEIRPVTSLQTWPLRSRVLKPFLRPEECGNPGDDDPTTLHLGAFLSGELVGVATFIAEAHPEFAKAQVSYRLRGMATASEHRRRGIGRALVQSGEDRLRRGSCDLVWFNAREIAFPFYRSLGYEFHGGTFELPRIGPHKLMYKFL